jgi:hypothetical protein
MKGIKPMYKIIYIYAPYSPKYFKTEIEAREFQKSEICATELQKKTIFGQWKGRQSNKRGK